MRKPFGPRGHVLLVRDTAHVHSPAGGQDTLPFSYQTLRPEPWLIVFTSRFEYRYLRCGKLWAIRYLSISVAALKMITYSKSTARGALLLLRT